MSAEDCKIHAKRVDDLERRVESHHVRLHKQDNNLTEVKMQAGLLDMDFNHHQRDVLKSIEALRDTVEAMAKIASEDREKRIAMNAKVGNHGTYLKWLLTSATAIGVGCAIAVIAHFATKS